MANVKSTCFTSLTTRQSTVVRKQSWVADSHLFPTPAEPVSPPETHIVGGWRKAVPVPICHPSAGKEPEVWGGKVPWSLFMLDVGLAVFPQTVSNSGVWEFQPQNGQAPSPSPTQFRDSQCPWDNPPGLDWLRTQKGNTVGFKSIP